MALTLFGASGRSTHRRRPGPRPDPEGARRSHHLRLMTLNVAHARKEGRHQALQSVSTLRRNLEEIANVLRREEPHVVALQEADGPSAWSGSFDHVELLAHLGGFEHAFRGEHNPVALGRLELSYGTALLSRLPLEEPRSHAFFETWRDTKGFVAATVSARALGGAIDIVSLHLDFLAARVRRRQIEQLVERFRQRTRPLVVMGDFNCEWSERRRSLEKLRHELRLRPPAGAAHATFPAWRPLVRLDWILVSDELDYFTYETLPDRLSDHLGVVAEIRPRGEAADAAGDRRRRHRRLADGRRVGAL